MVVIGDDMMFEACGAWRWTGSQMSGCWRTGCVPMPFSNPARRGEVTG